MKRFEVILYSLLVLFLFCVYYKTKTLLALKPIATAETEFLSTKSIVSDTAKAIIITSLQKQAYPLIFEAAFTPATKVLQGIDSLRFSVSELGDLKSKSGILVACDPISIHAARGFTQLFPKGQFLVQLALAHFRGNERVAFSRVVFSSEPVLTWQIATSPGQTPLALTDSQTYCYPVDMGAGIFADKQATEAIDAKGQQVWEDIFITKAGQHDYGGFIHSFDGHNLATFSTGLGDGCYTTYIGYDHRGNVCRLLTDFELLEW
jgi:hypothetical protein